MKTELELYIKANYAKLEGDMLRAVEDAFESAWQSRVPEGYVVSFKNGIKTDCRIENLILLTRAELVRLNQSFIKLSTPETHETCVLLAKLKSKAHELKVA